MCINNVCVFICICLSISALSVCLFIYIYLSAYMYTCMLNSRRCHFKNLDHKYRCVECSRKRPTKTYLAPEGKEDTNLTTDALGEQLDVKLPLGGKTKAHRKEGSNSSSSDQEKDQETSVKTGALHDDDVSHSDIAFSPSIGTITTRHSR